MTGMISIGWDIGGVNLKVARVRADGDVKAISEAFSIERDGDQLAAALARLARALGAERGPHAVTMTAELSRRFRTKEEGVDAVLGALEEALPGSTLRIFDTAGTFVSPTEARRAPLSVAASNWLATAMIIAERHPDTIMIDMGSTTTDIIPIEGGHVVARGRTDPDRLASGELVYSGALRTPLEAIVTRAPWRGGMVRVAADEFACSADIHCWLGTLPDSAFSDPGRMLARGQAGDHIARFICADRTLVDDDGITAIARHVSSAQCSDIAGAITEVRGRHPAVRSAVVLGLGAPIAKMAAEQAGLEVLPLDWDADASRAAPAVAVARLALRD